MKVISCPTPAFFFLTIESKLIRNRIGSNFVVSKDCFASEICMNHSSWRKRWVVHKNEVSDNFKFFVSSGRDIVNINAPTKIVGRSPTAVHLAEEE